MPAERFHSSPASAAAANCILAINGGSSSIKFAAFAVDGGRQIRRLFDGAVQRIGVPGTVLTASGADGQPQRIDISASDHAQAAQQLIGWLRQRLGSTHIAAIGHRVVHGGTRLLEHQIVDEAMIAELKRTQPLDLAHLPREIALIETFRSGLPGVPQVACFDTAFHRDLPKVAQLLPIPRHYSDAGVRRLGFHGLSYAYLMEQLRRVAGAAAEGRVILAHLGSGASMVAMYRGKPIDTTMAFTPTSGLVMGTRPGDLDPGLMVYMMRVEKLTPQAMDEFISRQCGLIGVSQTTSDMHDLVARRGQDQRAAEAVDLFCYQARKWIGAYAAALGGLETLVFSGGIGEHGPEVRAGVCQGLEFLGLRLDSARNAASEPVISADGGAVTVRVIATDEELMIAKTVCQLVAVSQCT